MQHVLVLVKNASLRNMYLQHSDRLWAFAYDTILWWTGSVRSSCASLMCPAHIPLRPSTSTFTLASYVLVPQSTFTLRFSQSLYLNQPSPYALASVSSSVERHSRPLHLQPVEVPHNGATHVYLRPDRLMHTQDRLSFWHRVVPYSTYVAPREEPGSDTTCHGHRLPKPVRHLEVHSYLKTSLSAYACQLVSPCLGLILLAELVLFSVAALGISDSYTQVWLQSETRLWRDLLDLYGAP
ncbi:unnamed protein product [Linum trigynum]|uniref:Uncharacterized protein n=1 Tax=Linum trigynum TaxID=586398 RepID=A0AAV2CD85_9ROSI